MNNISLAPNVASQNKLVQNPIVNNPTTTIRFIAAGKKITNDQGGSQTSDKNIYSRPLMTACDPSKVCNYLQQQEHSSSSSDKVPNLAEPILPSNDKSENNQAINQAEQTAFGVYSQSQESIILDDMLEVGKGSMPGPDDPHGCFIEELLAKTENDDLNETLAIIENPNFFNTLIDDGVTGKQAGISAERVFDTREDSTKMLVGDDQEAVAEAGLPEPASLCPSPNPSRKRALNELKSPGYGSGEEAEAEGDEFSQKISKLETNMANASNMRTQRTSNMKTQGTTERECFAFIANSLIELGVRKTNGPKIQVLLDALNKIRTEGGHDSVALLKPKGKRGRKEGVKMSDRGRKEKAAYTYQSNKSIRDSIDVTSPEFTNFVTNFGKNYEKLSCKKTAFSKYKAAENKFFNQWKTKYDDAEEAWNYVTTYAAIKSKAGKLGMIATYAETMENYLDARPIDETTGKPITMDEWMQPRKSDGTLYINSRKQRKSMEIGKAKYKEEHAEAVKKANKKSEQKRNENFKSLYEQLKEDLKLDCRATNLEVLEELKAALAKLPKPDMCTGLIEPDTLIRDNL